jgi:hypothetical protein
MACLAANERTGHPSTPTVPTSDPGKVDHGRRIGKAPECHIAFITPYDSLHTGSAENALDAATFEVCQHMLSDVCSL